MLENEKLSSSLEDYLEAIFHILSEKQAVRAKDISDRLHVKNSSVTGALRSLAEKGFINYAPYDVITLTTKGKHLAEDIVRRHEALLDFFVNVLGVDRYEAEIAACKMEHNLSGPILDKLICFMEFIDICPRSGQEWIKGFRYYCKPGDSQMRCGDFFTNCMNDLKKREKGLKHQTRSLVSLYEMTPGQRGKLLKLKGGSETKKRMDRLGIAPGSIIEIEKGKNGEDSIYFKVRGYHLSLTKDEAAEVTVEPCF
jgi:DtxR family Mn-dependent transcriptional regulator